MDEMIDVISPFLYMSPPKGNNVGIVGLGGGASVLAADDCAGAGLSLPRLPEEVKLKLKAINTKAGNIFNNPVDTQAFFIGFEQLSQTVKTVLNWEEIDTLILHIDFELTGFPLSSSMAEEFAGEYLKLMINLAGGSNKPAVIVLHSSGLTETSQVILEGQRLCREAKVASFPSFRRAANAISKFIEYYSKEGKPEDV
jgi:acyl-CoA synthetase (NDP forming)